jgi:alanyl-tRNA synthetase
MTSEEIRESFLEFFKNKGHAIVPSSSLITDDPSVLLTTAGMQQFKRYYTGELDALTDFGAKNTASIQKCFRTSDIELIGDETHLSFFEMLGNFSFGGYFKKGSIEYAYEFVTKILNIDPDRVKVSVFGGDAEVPFDEDSYKIWKEEIGIPEEKIIRGKREDNFWGPTGEEGPCGPTTEIYVDDVEIWNLVFNEYYQESSKFKVQSSKLRKVNNPGVDTGMGFERLAAVLQNTDDVFETDIFQQLVSKIKELAPPVEKRIIRILADHLRAAVFLIADGVRPSNKEAGYVLRRLLRRIMAHEVKYDIHADLFPAGVEIIKEKFGEIYPEVKEKRMILEILEEEKQKFQEAIGKGIKEIEKLASRNQEIKSEDAFYLYETFGLPFEMILELASKEAVKNLRKEDFDKEFEKHQEVSRAGAEKKFGGHGLVLDTGELKAGSEEEMQKVIRLHTATHLLHWALREILGKEVKQTGSDINPERTRFDFSFNRKITAEEIKKVEDLVNQKIQEDPPVSFKEMPKEEAEKTGALHFFKQKYPDVVKVYFIGPSVEFCGGPHVERAGEIGEFKITKEEAVGAGARRIRATVL